jgi:hypothetical protein
LELSSVSAGVGDLVELVVPVVEAVDAEAEVLWPDFSEDEEAGEELDELAGLAEELLDAELLEPLLLSLPFFGVPPEDVDEPLPPALLTVELLLVVLSPLVTVCPEVVLVSAATAVSGVYQLIQDPPLHVPSSPATIVLASKA